MELSDEQWELLEPLIAEPRRRADGKGRPRRAAKEVLEGILWILRTGAQWADLPERYPPYQTCHRRFQEWVREGILRDVLEVLAQDLEERGRIDLSECFIDATFVVAKKGAQGWVRLSGAKVARSWQYPTLLVLASPSTLHLLARMKSPLYMRLSHLDMSKANQNAS
jgi:transposase